MVMPFVVARTASVRALEHALAGDKRIFLAAQHDAPIDDPCPEDIYTMGCVAKVVQSLKLPDGTIKVLVEGVERARAVEWDKTRGFYRVVVEVLPKQREARGDAESVMRRVVSMFEQYVKLSNDPHSNAPIAAVRVDDPGKLADTIAAHLLVSVGEKQNLLEIISPIERLDRISGLLQIELDNGQLELRVQARIDEQIEKMRTEYYVNARKQAIQTEIDDLKAKIEAGGMPEDVEKQTANEITRLELMSRIASETKAPPNFRDSPSSFPLPNPRWKGHL
jgi:ATP-dependent Lon protease